MLQLENLSFQVADASASQKEIIKNLNSPSAITASS